MSAHLEFVTPPAPAGYSPAVSAAPGCRLVWVSGQLPFGPDGTIVAPGDCELQTRQTFQNVGAALAAAGAGWSDVVKLNIYVDRKSTRLNSSHGKLSRMPSSA